MWVLNACAHDGLAATGVSAEIIRAQANGECVWVDVLVRNRSLRPLSLLLGRQYPFVSEAVDGQELQLSLFEPYANWRSPAVPPSGHRIAPAGRMFARIELPLPAARDGGALSERAHLPRSVAITFGVVRAHPAEALGSGDVLISQRFVTTAGSPVEQVPNSLRCAVGRVVLLRRDPAQGARGPDVVGEIVHQMRRGVCVSGGRFDCEPQELSEDLQEVLNRVVGSPVRGTRLPGRGHQRGTATGGAALPISGRDVCHTTEPLSRCDQTCPWPPGADLLRHPDLCEYRARRCPRPPSRPAHR